MNKKYFITYQQMDVGPNAIHSMTIEEYPPTWLERINTPPPHHDPNLPWNRYVLLFYAEIIE